MQFPNKMSEAQRVVVLWHHLEKVERAIADTKKARRDLIKDLPEVQSADAKLDALAADRAKLLDDIRDNGRRAIVTQLELWPETDRLLEA